MLQLYDVNHNKISLISNYKDYHVEQVINTDDLLYFLYPVDDPQYPLIAFECYIRDVNNEYVVKEINAHGDDWAQFVCKINLEDLKGHVVSNFETVEQLAEDSANLALAGTGWTVGYCDVTKRRTVRKTQCSVYNVLKELATAYACEITYNAVKKTINIHQKQGADRGVYFAEQLNLKQLDTQANSHGYVTRLIPVGKDGLDITSVNSGINYVSNYQYSTKVITAYWVDNRYTDAQSLHDDAVARLVYLSKPIRAYSADIIDLASVSEEWNLLDFGLGDFITLMSESKGVREQQRIIKIDRYPEEPDRSTVEIANRIASLTDIISRAVDTSDTVDVTTDTTNAVMATSVEGNLNNAYIPMQNVGELNVTVANIGTLIATKATITDLQAETARINNLIATSATIENLTATNARIGTLEATSATIDNLTAATARIGILEANSITVDQLNVVDAKITNLVVTNAMIDNLAVDTAKIANAAITTAKIGDAQITSAQIALANITTALIGDAQITSAKIALAQITTALIADANITNAKIDRASVDKLVVVTADIADANITNAKIANLAVTVAKIADATITSAKIANATIEGAKIANATIGTAQISLGAITTALIANAAIGSTQISDASITDAKIVGVTASKITAGTIDAGVINVTNLNAANITVGTINGNQIASGAIDVTKLGTALVTDIDSKITQTEVDVSINAIQVGGRNLLLDSGMLVTNSDYNIQIYYLAQTPTVGETYTITIKGQLGEGKYKFGAWNSGGTVNLAYITDIGDGFHQATFIWKNSYNGYTANDTSVYIYALYTATVAESSIEWVKLEKGNKATDWTPAVEDLCAQIDTVQATADGKNTVHYSTAQPSLTGNTVDDIWFDTDDGNKMYKWTGSVWTAAQFGTNAIASATITNALIADATIQNAKIANIDAGKVNTGYLSAARIEALSIDASKLVANTITAGQIASNTITAAQIASTTITASQISTETITATQIAAATITGDKLVINTITAREIAANTITATQMVAGTITAASGIIADAAITTAKIAAAQITTALIDDAAITTAKIGSAQVTTALIADAQITGAKIVNATITNAQIALATITDAQIANATITNAKILNVDAIKITTGLLSADRIGANTITTSHLLVSDPNLISDVDSFEQYNGKEPPGSKGYLTTCTVTDEEAYHGLYSLKTVSSAANSYKYLCPTVNSNTGWIKLEVGKRYIISAYVKTTSVTATGAQIAFIVREGKTTTIGVGSVTATTSISLASGWTRMSALSPVVGGTNPYASFYVRNNGAGTTIYWDAIQIEEYIAGNTSPSQFGTGGAVTLDGGNIVANTVTATQIAAGTITAASAILADAVVTTAKIALATITDAQIASATITSAKIASLDAAKITSGYIAAARIAAGTITATMLSATSIDGKTITGATVRTSSGSNRLQMDTTSFKAYYANVLRSETDYRSSKYYDPAGSLLGTIVADTNIYDGSTNVFGIYVPYSASYTRVLNIVAPKIIMEVSTGCFVEGNMGVSGALSSELESSFSNGSIFVDPWVNTLCAIKASGNVGVGGNLKVNGTVYYGALSQSSERSIKKDIVNLDIDALSVINNLNLYSFRYKSDDIYSPIKYGSMFEEVPPEYQTVAKYVNVSEPKGIDITKVIWTNTRAIQQLNEITESYVQALQDEINDLYEKIEKLERGKII